MPAATPLCLKAVEGGVRHRRVLEMDADEIAAGLGELIDLRQQNVVRGHQVHVDRQACRSPDRRDKVGEEQKGGREVTVCHVDMQDVGIGFDADQLIAEAKEIGRPHGELGDRTPEGQVVDPGGRRSQHQAKFSQEASERGAKVSDISGPILRFGRDLDQATIRG